MLHLALTLTLTLTAHIFAILTATVKAGEFLQPWTSGSVKDYSHNINYAVGVHILTEWEADFTNATIVLNQDNKPGDAPSGPFVVLERKSSFYSFPDLEVFGPPNQSQGPGTRRHGDGQCPTKEWTLPSTTCSTLQSRMPTALKASPGIISISVMPRRRQRRLQQQQRVALPVVQAYPRHLPPLQHHQD